MRTKIIRSAVACYGTAVAAIALAVLARMALAPYLHDRLLFASFSAGIAATAWLCGWKPALLSAGLGVLGAKFFFISPRFTLRFDRTEDVLVALIYFIASLVIIAFIRNLEKERDKALLQKSQVEREIADRKKAEEALREKDELVNHAQAIANLGSWIVNLPENQISWSDQVYRIFGVPPQEFGGTTEEFLQSVHPEDREAVRSAYVKSLRDGSPSCEIEHRIVRKTTGEVRIILEKCAHFRDKSGRVIRSVGMVHDITRRKSMEEELRRSEEKARNLIRYAPTGIYEIDFDGPKFVRVNEAMCQFLGYTESELLAMNPLDLLIESDKATTQKRIERRLAGDNIDADVEHKIKAKDGREYDIVLTTTLTFRDGKAQGAFVIGHDITQRKRMEEELRRAEERARLALRAGKMGTWDRILPDGEIIWNDERFRMLGYEPGTVRPSHEKLLERVHPDDRAELDRGFQRSLHEGGEYKAEFRLVLPDRTTRWTEARGQIDLDASGRARRSYGVMIDITERKRMEEELRQSRDKLDERVRERTAQLQESEKRSRELASELIDAQETERKRIAHELHDSLAAQLAAIKYRLERKLNAGESPQNPITLQEIIQDVQNANAETRRIMANLRPSVLDDIGIIPALSWFSRETEKTYPGTGVEISGGVEDWEVPEKLKIVLFRIAQESVTNAIRHGNAMRIRIDLEKKDVWLRLSVQDNGKGFDSMKQGEASGSHGIGLNSMQQRVDSTGGIFSVISLPGQGTTVKAEWRIP